MAVSETWTDPVANHDLATGNVVSETIWDQVMSNILYAGRMAEPVFTNKSGSSQPQGAVVTIETTNASAFTTTTEQGNHRVLGAVIESSIANNATGRIGVSGSRTVNVQGNVAIGDFLECSTTAGRARSARAFRTAGSFAIALTAYVGGGAGSVTAVLLSAASGGKPKVLSTTGTPFSFTNTVSETAVWSYTLPANTMALDKMLRVRLWSYWINNVTTNPTITWKLKFGGTQIFTNPGVDGGAASAARRWLNAEWLIKNMDSTNAQSHANMLKPMQGTAITTSQLLEATSAIDTTADVSMQLTWTFPAASANYEAGLLGAEVSLVTD